MCRRARAYRWRSCSAVRIVELPPLCVAVAPCPVAIGSNVEVLVGWECGIVAGYGIVAVNVDCESPAKLKEVRGAIAWSGPSTFCRRQELMQCVFVTAIQATMVQLLSDTVATKGGKPAKKAKLYTPSPTNALQLTASQGKKPVRQIRRITLKLDDIASAHAMVRDRC